MERVGEQSPAQLALLEKFPDKSQFLTAYNPDHQMRYCADLQRVYAGSAPTLGLVARTYGDKTMLAWLQIQLQELAGYSGVMVKLDLNKYQQLSELIAARYGALKVSELMHFFQLCKQGEYGKLFFGAVDPIAIMDALKQFYVKAIERRAMYKRGEAVREESQHARRLAQFRSRWQQRIPPELQHTIIYSVYMRLGYDMLSDAEVAQRIATGRYLTDLDNLKPLSIRT